LDSTKGEQALSGKAILTLKGACKNFGGLMAVDHLDMEVVSGQVCGLIGPNGAGKTTVFNLITGVYRCLRGSIHLEEKEITREKPYRIIRSGVARTFQTIRLFSNLSTMEHVLVGQNFLTKSGAGSPRAGLPGTGLRLGDEAEELLKLLGLWESRNQRPNTLSYGSQRKVEIARALATRPRLLLLDEPVAGMNARETKELLAIISKIRKMGITILLIDHDMKFVMGLCDRIYVLNFGRKIAEGTPQEIQHNESVLEAYLGREE
jgi:branched-chain amino acid transport system ATP-binding protein